MGSLEKRKEQRLLLLHGLYEEVDGNQYASVKFWELGERLGLDETETELVYQYLIGEGLMKARAMGGVVSITHWGVKQVEAALEHPQEPTQYFPPAINVIQIETAIGSQIQQGSPGASQVVSLSATQSEEVRLVLEAVVAALPELSLSADGEREAQAQVGTALAQIQAEAPDKGIVRTALTRLKGVLEGGAAAAGATDLVTKIVKLLAGL